jgi:hypothetical protein
MPESKQPRFVVLGPPKSDPNCFVIYDNVEKRTWNGGEDEAIEFKSYAEGQAKADELNAQYATPLTADEEQAHLSNAAPCRFCNSSDLYIPIVHFHHWAVACDRCEAQGPVSVSPEEAVKKWGTK